MSLNKAMLIGNVGKDPDVRYLDGKNSTPSSSTKVASFTLATTDRYRDRAGTLQENTEWHNISVWGNLADTVEKYVKKGTQLYIEGRIRTRSWTDQTGAKRYTTEIVASNIQLLGRKDSAEGASAPAAPVQAAAPAPVQTPVQAASPAAPVVDDNPSDDLPF
ncbi:MAG: single-stranded DNA-binding protein [Bacteroidales bacterium]|nr:single-stranded DNA-binding protein [Bacteroidales bacterium]